MRNLNDKVWVSKHSPIAPFHETCPDCGGTGMVRVIFHDNTIVRCECGNCSRGYEPPTGTCLVYRSTADAQQGFITGIELGNDKTEYRVNCGENIYIQNEASVFDTEAEARIYAEKRMEAHEEEQRQKINKKEKDIKSWAWNASYHRGKIKSAQKELDYHAAKLAVASVKSKEKQNEVA